MLQKKNKMLNFKCFQRLILVTGEFMKNNFEFRTIFQNEAHIAAQIEYTCFPPNEACSEKSMILRIAAAADLFLVAMDKENGKMAGFLNGMATDEEKFRDGFFTDAGLNDPAGKNIMLLGLDVLPQYRGQGLATELMNRYIERERKRGRESLILTCLDGKISMYEKMGYEYIGISASVWGGEQWHDMVYRLNR